MTLGQVAVADKTNEITAIQELLSGLFITGRIISVDALLTQREVAQTIIEQGGDYLMVVKGNQPALREEIEAVFAEREQPCEEMRQAETLESGHGRIEARRLRASTVLSGYSDWPGMQQVCQIQRWVTIKRAGEQTSEGIYAITSLSRERAGAEKLLKISRGHWSIENKSHWVRDVTYDEDRSQVRSGNIPQVMAALRNTAIGIMRLMGETNIAAACRRFAAKPWLALAVIGSHQKTE